MDLAWLPALTIGLLTFALVKFWNDVKSLPPGPLPIPLIGNMFLLWKNRNNVSELLAALKRKYRGIYTLWIFSRPVVIVSDWEMIKEGLLTKGDHFISRPDLRSTRYVTQHGDAIVFQTNNKEWEVCRKVAHRAIRKFSDSYVLADIIGRNTNETLRDALTTGQPFDALKTAENLSFAIVAQTAFGLNKITEEEKNVFKELFESFHDNMNFCPGDFSLVLRPFFTRVEKNLRRMTDNMAAFLTEKLRQVQEGYVHGEIRHFADSVINSGKEAEDEESGNAQYLTDHHKMKILADLFTAATDSTSNSLSWIFLALATFPSIQERIRNEIDQAMGCRLPLQESKRDCPYTWAFISEILRLRQPGTMLIPHASNVDTSLGKRNIPKGTMVFFDASSSHSDAGLWDEPEIFKPERFLDDEGKYSTRKKAGYIPFGDGKRICIGEKMARQDLFLVIANVLQKVEILYHGPKNRIQMERVNNPLLNIPKDFQIRILPRKNSNSTDPN